MWWFLLCVCNMGGPPSVNLIREIISLTAVLNSSFTTRFSLILVTGLAVAYSLILYASSQQGQLSASKVNNFPLSLRELNLMSSHVVPRFSLRLVVCLVLP